MLINGAWPLKSGTHYTVKSLVEKASCWRTDAFQLWCRRRLWRIPGQHQTSQLSRKSALSLWWDDWTEAAALLLWPPDSKSWLIRKDPDAGKDWGQWEKGTAEDEMAEWHHQIKGHESEQAPGDSEGQRSLVCCSPWGCKKLDTT